MIHITFNLWFFIALYAGMILGMFKYDRFVAWLTYGVVFAWAVFILVWAIVGGTVNLSTSSDNVFATFYLNGLLSILNV